MCKAAYGSPLSVFHAVLTLTAAVIIVLLSVMPRMSLNPETPANSGITAHIIAYATLSLLTGLWLRVAGNSKYPLVSAFFLSSLYGVLVECVQFWLPYRTFETGDILINCLAAALAVPPCYAMMRYVPLYKKNVGKGDASSRLNV